MLKKAFVGAMVAGAIMLSGCTTAKTERIEDLSKQVQGVEQKVEKLQTDVKGLKQETLIVRGEAARANQRLDNQAQSYRK